MRCPKCGSENILITNGSYPNSYECLDCGFTFVKMVNALIDE